MRTRVLAEASSVIGWVWGDAAARVRMGWDARAEGHRLIAGLTCVTTRVLGLP